MRAIKDELVERVTGQQKAFGGLPDVQAAERYISKHRILEKTERDHEERRARDIVRRPSKKTPWTPLPEDGKPTSLGRPRGVNPALLAEHTIAFSEPDPRMLKRRHRRKKNVIVEWFRFLAKMPEWRKRIGDCVVGTADSPGETVAVRGGRATLTDQGKDTLLKIYADSVRLFGDPLKPKEKKVIVG